MYISHQKRILFIHIQKTGGMAIESALRNICPDLQAVFPDRHCFASSAKIILGEEIWNSYYKFCFVRNPFDRMVSWYNMITKNKEHRNTLQQQVIENSKNYDDFLKVCTLPNFGMHENSPQIKSFTWNQCDHFLDPKTGEVLVDFIGRYENLQEDFDKILKNINQPKIIIPVVNKNEHAHYRDYYKDELSKEIIKTRFKKDLDYFQYSF